METKYRLDSLAGLRWIAAAVVAVAHLSDVSHDPALGRVLVRMLSEGLYGLTFFFMLSGFVLAYGYHDRLARPTFGTLRGYYVARVARIWPLHLLTLALAMILTVSPWPGGIAPLTANVFLVHSWIPDLSYIQSYNSVSWTLSLEAFFYLVCPLLLWLVAKWSEVRPSRLYAAAAGVWLLTIAIVLPHAGDSGIWPLYICNVCPAVRFGEFAVGVFLGLAFVRGKVRPGPAETPQSRRWWTVLELLTIASMIWLIYRSHKVPLLFRMNGYYTPAVAVLVTVFARQRGAISRMLASGPSVYLSNISFAFYLLHGILFVHVGGLLSPWLGAWPKAGALILITGLTAALVFHRIELPMRERIIRWAGPKKPSAILPFPGTQPERLAS